MKSKNKCFHINLNDNLLGLILCCPQLFMLLWVSAPLSKLIKTYTQTDSWYSFSHLCSIAVSAHNLGKRKHPRTKNRHAMTHGFATKSSVWCSPHLFVSLCPHERHIMSLCVYVPKGQRLIPLLSVALARCSAILGCLTIPYCPLPVDSALLTGQHGY